jgi:hypothetical protein
MGSKGEKVFKMKFILQYSTPQRDYVAHTYEGIEWRDAVRRGFDRVRHDFSGCSVKEHKLLHNVCIYTVNRYDDEIAVCSLTAIHEAPKALESGEIAWRSTTVGYKKFITHEKFSRKVQAWYEPYRCANCQPKEEE